MRDPHPERFLYLRDLFTELQDTKSIDCRHQVLANISNFCYDPANAEFLLRLGAPETLLKTLADEDAVLRKFAAAGVCNLCLEPKNRAALLREGLLPALLTCLEESCTETVNYALTTLLLLPVYQPHLLAQVSASQLVQLVSGHSQSADRRTANLATLLLRQLPDGGSANPNEAVGSNVASADSATS